MGSVAIVSLIRSFTSLPILWSYSSMSITPVTLSFLHPVYNYIYVFLLMLDSSLTVGLFEKFWRHLGVWFQ